MTIIRPVKGVEPCLYECLASTFHQRYPQSQTTVYFCIASRDDPALPILQRLLTDFPEFDAKIFVEEEDPNLSGEGGRASNLGPNPKIRNMSRAYREAKGDIMWIVDCNVWIGSSVANRMVDLLCGFTIDSAAPTKKKYMFVHQLPLSVDISPSSPTSSVWSRIQQSGGLLEETFLSTSHAKFYTAINTVAIAPCIVGKSNMFRRSHLNALTSSPSNMNPDPYPPPGIDHFSSNICEDHLIGDLLWKSPVPSTISALASQEGRPPVSSNDTDPPGGGEPIKWGKHAILPPSSPSNLAIQPTTSYSLRTYIDRRTRWLRVRKFTVTLATLVEPGTESFLCSAYAAFALTTLPWFHTACRIPQNRTAFALIWLAIVICWAGVDYWVWGMLHRHHHHDMNRDSAHHGDDNDHDSPPFAKTQAQTRPWWAWVTAWLGREILAFPIWAWAFFGGVTVVWRGRKFWVGVDMRVHEIEGGAMESEENSGGASSSFSSSSRGERERERLSARDKDRDNSGARFHDGGAGESGSGGESGGWKSRRD